MLKKDGILGAFKDAIMNSYTNIDGLPKEIIKNTYNQSNGKTGLSKMLPIVVMVATLGIPCMCDQAPPLVANNSDKPIIVSENTPTGTVLRVLEATDPDNDTITIRFPVYETESKTLLTIRQTTNEPGIANAELVLKTELDRDYAFDRAKLYLVLEDSGHNRFQVTVVIDIRVTDINDEVPVFQNLPYRVDLSEDVPDMSFTYTNIKAVDPDTGVGGLISYFMEPNTQSTSDAETFRQTFIIDESTGDVTLHRPIDFEKISYFQYIVFAVDGDGLNSTNELIIRILDVQDTPPQIQGTPYVITIPENIEVGYHFFTVRALDGDRGVPNEVAFSFVSGTCMNLFQIHKATGEIIIAQEIDRDSGEIKDNDGVCEIIIQVVEVQTNFPQKGETVARTLFTVFVSDLNDNLPLFSQTVYHAFIEDTAQLNHPIKFENDSRIIVKDNDQASNGVMEIMLRGQDGALTYDFEPVPNIVASNGVPLIKLKSPDILYAGSESFTFEIIAIERDTPEKYSSTATLSISIIQVRTTTPSTTTVRTTPIPRYKDPFIPSLLGALFAVILLIWASVTTALYCYKRKLMNNNKVAPYDLPHPPPERVIMSPIKTNGTHLPPVVSTNA